MNRLACLSLICFSACCSMPGVADVLYPCAPDAVRLEGWAGDKMNRFFSERIYSPFAREVIFAEARAAFAMKMDDASGVGGFWQGEFWGKLMMGVSRVQMYSKDSDLRHYSR